MPAVTDVNRLSVGNTPQGIANHCTEEKNHIESDDIQTPTAPQNSIFARRFASYTDVPKSMACRLADAVVSKKQQAICTSCEGLPHPANVGGHITGLIRMHQGSVSAMPSTSYHYDLLIVGLVPGFSLLG